MAKRIRLGMVGGGQGAFIGEVHRLAARLDNRFELCAGALSADPERARASAQELGISADRAYVSFEEMAQAESQREDGAVLTISGSIAKAGRKWNSTTTQSPDSPIASIWRIGTHNTPQKDDARKIINNA